MPRPAKQDGQDRSSRYRSNKRRQGMRLLRIWVPDPCAPGFAAEARRQAELINSAPDEHDTMDFIEAIMDWGDDT
jgi:hypothetical protein